MRSNRLLVFFAVLFFFPSCYRGEDYYSFRQIGSSNWSRQTVLEYFLDSLPVDPGKRYDVWIEIVSSKRYPYRNLWLGICQNLSDTVFRNDTLEIELADKYGKPFGRGAAGLYQLSLPYKTGILLDSVRSYRIALRHEMKEDTLRGVEKVGIKVCASGAGDAAD